MSHNNTGSTLILSLIILSVLLATASVFAVTALSNFRQSRNIDQSIVSYYLADIGVERGAYYFRQHNIAIDSCAPAGSLEMGDCDLQIEAEDRGDVGFLEEDTSVQLDIYAPGISAPDIRYLYLNWYDCDPECFPVPRIEVSWVGWTGTSFSSPTKTSPPLSDPDGPAPVDLHSNGVGDCDFYRVRIKALLNDVNSLQVTAWNSAQTQQQNIPGIFEAKAIGSYGRTKQASAITASHFSPLSGLYDYVLFSEEGLSKTYCGDGVVAGSEQCDDGRQCSAGGVDCTAGGSVICYYEDPGNPGEYITIGDGSCLPRNNDGCNAACEIE